MPDEGTLMLFRTAQRPLASRRLRPGAPLPSRARRCGDRCGIGAAAAAAAAGIVLIMTSCIVLAADEERGSGEWRAPGREARKSNPVPTDERSLRKGEEIYAAECLDCHGEKGHGDGPGARDLKPAPPNLADSTMWEQTDGELFWKIKVGREPMPAYEELIGEDEMWSVVNYIRTLAPQPPPPGSGDEDDEKGPTHTSTPKPSGNDE